MQVENDLQGAQREVIKLETVLEQLKQQQTTLSRPLSKKRAMLNVRNLTLFAVFFGVNLALNWAFHSGHC